MLLGEVVSDWESAHEVQLYSLGKVSNGHYCFIYYDMKKWHDISYEKRANIFGKSLYPLED